MSAASRTLAAMMEPISITVQALLNVLAINVKAVRRRKLSCAFPCGDFLLKEPGVAFILFVAKLGVAKLM